MVYPLKFTLDFVMGFGFGFALLAFFADFMVLYAFRFIAGLAVFLDSTFFMFLAVCVFLLDSADFLAFLSFLLIFSPLNEI